jgi:hypothetical protein
LLSSQILPYALEEEIIARFFLGTSRMQMQHERISISAQRYVKWPISTLHQRVSERRSKRASL